MFYNLQKFRRFFKFVTLLRVEPYMVLMGGCLLMRKTPLDMLIQDKLCRNKYNMSEEFCTNLADMKESEKNYEYKSLVLGDAVQYNMYHTLITFIPGIVWCLFLGAWIDKYKHGRKAIFLIGSITQSMEAAINALNAYYFDSNINYILVSFIPYTFSGSMTWTTAYSYIAVTTPTKHKAMRMTILEILLAIAYPTGTAVAGKLLMLSPFGKNGQLHNYALIFLISSIGSFLAFLWAVFAINQQKDAKAFEENFGENNSVIDLKKEYESDNINKSIHPLKLLFDLKNIKEIIQTCIKKRSNYVRAQIWLIILSMFCHLFVRMSPGSFLFQFVEKVYEWDAETYSYISSVGAIVNTAIVIAVAPILIKVFKINDMGIAIFGFSGLFFENIIRGMILTPMGFYIAVVVSGTSGLASIGFRAHASKIVDKSELGKVFTLMSVIDAIAPIIGASLFTILFKVTIDKIPGTCFLVLGLMSLIPIIIAMGIDILNLSRAKANHNCKKELSDSVISEL